MPAKILTLDPVTRIEGHLRLDLTIIDRVIVSARSSGTSYRGFEPILAGRDPRDAVHITQRICGVCPVPHATAATAAFEMAAGVAINAQARLIRNVVAAANFLDSHLLHFYVLSLPDFVAGLPTAGGWPADAPPRVWEDRDGLDPASLANGLVASLAARRACAKIATLLGGKMPHPVGIVAGGATALVTAEMKAALAALAMEVEDFISNRYQPDVEAVVLAFREYLDIGASGAGFISYGGYPEADGSLTLAAGLVAPHGTTRETLNTELISESVACSRYAAGVPAGPRVGDTVPDLSRSDAYSWCKAPRLAGHSCEVGPLARSVVAGVAPPQRGVHARHLARVAEAQLLARRLVAWIASLEPGVSACPVFPTPPASGVGCGLVEAPRGALGHWVTIEGGVIQRYQVISPTTWNGSPRDELGQPGALEMALEGLSVADPSDPVEVQRVVHSFDPCLQCAVH